MTTTPPAPPYERYADALAALPARDRQAPLGLLDLDAFTANARSMAQRADGTPIRLATKSVRIRRGIDAALTMPGFRHIMAFTLAEALWLSGADDSTHAESRATESAREHRNVLVAYPCVDEHALTQMLRSAPARERITLMVDSAEYLSLLSDIGRRAGLGGRSGLEADGLPPLRLCLELDAGWRPHPRLHLGALRSPTRTPADAATLARTITGTPGCALVGLMAYEAQVAGVADKPSQPSTLLARAQGFAKSGVVQAVKRASLRELRSRRTAAVEAVREVVEAAGGRLEFVNGGGTGSIDATTTHDCITEIGAGSGLMGPALFDGYRTFRPNPASFFVCPVARRPGPGVVTVAGGGWAASGVCGPDRAPAVVWPEGLRYSCSEGAGEVQTPLLGTATDSLSLGDPVFFRHAKGGEPAERATVVAVYSATEDAIVDLWPTYRGEGKAFQ
ncbi:alanine racemase [uncultured Micrococcus sp.]|uniref:alanine racemase n=1 Tax=uncultured Micrococcus sp. TaxID=114051 RepID=UPI002594938F|nr:alanine racemase [uncultured Micrococcus sp.]